VGEGKNELRDIQAATSMLSYPAPLWQIYFIDDGSLETSSASKGPVNWDLSTLPRS
jgi:hypothetical protein